MLPEFRYFSKNFRGKICLIAKHLFTYYGFGLSMESHGNECPGLLDPCCLFHHICILGISITCPYNRIPSASIHLVEFLFFSADKGSESPYHTRENSRLLIDFHLLSPIYLLSPRPIPSPYMGSSVGVLYTRYR